MAAEKEVGAAAKAGPGPGGVPTAAGPGAGVLAAQVAALELALFFRPRAAKLSKQLAVRLEQFSVV
jgi:hypothetical protein